jgi:MSHA biogenesis protein MshN
MNDASLAGNRLFARSGDAAGMAAKSAGPAGSTPTWTADGMPTDTAADPGSADAGGARPARAAGATMAALAPASVRATAKPGPAVESNVEKRLRPGSPRERADAEYERGVAFHQQGQAEEARLAFVKALQADRHHIQARHALAVVFVSQNRLDDAQTVLGEGLEISPDQAQLRLVLGRIKAQRNDLPGAIESVKAALASGEASNTLAEPVQARALLATLQQSAGQHAAAIDNYAAALRQAPSNGAWWIGMGISLAADGRIESSREAFTRARSTESLTPELQQYVEDRLRQDAR